jgi:hypothetical protein
MPVTSFTPIVMHDWTGQSARPAPRPGKKGRPARRKPKRKPRRKARSAIPPQCRTVLIDRLEAAIESGLVRLCDEDMECDALDFTLAELALLQRILFPEEYAGPKRRAGKPTDTAPGSPDRIAVYAARREAGRPISAKGDVGAVHPDGRQLTVAERKNGSGRKVVGWADFFAGEGEE